MTKVHWLLALATLFLFSCKIQTYEISEQSLTQRIGNRYYIDVNTIDKLPEEKATFTVKTDSFLYLRAEEELRLKSG
ncbi:MAG: hypothetical protein AAGA62_18725, partial [Bacteroidota bacterium]